MWFKSCLKKMTITIYKEFSKYKTLFVFWNPDWFSSLFSNHFSAPSHSMTSLSNQLVPNGHMIKPRGTKRRIKLSPWLPCNPKHYCTCAIKRVESTQRFGDWPVGSALFSSTPERLYYNLVSALSSDVTHRFPLAKTWRFLSKFYKYKRRSFFRNFWKCVIFYPRLGIAWCL